MHLDSVRNGTSACLPSASEGKLLALRWRCWGGIKNLEAAAAGIELTAVADGIDAVLHRTTEAVRAGLVLVAHGLRGLLKTSTSSCQGRRIFATCESCLEAVQCLLHFLALWADRKSVV